MRIVQLNVENVKRVRAVEIKPTGDVVRIVGRNDQGKSSVLDAIWYALGGKDAVPPDPVRHGAEAARVVVDLGDLTAERRWVVDSGRTELVVRNREGARYPSPQAVLDAMVGRLCFDPLEFSRQRPVEQRAALLHAMGLAEEMADVDQERKKIYDQRTEGGRRLKELEAQLAGVPDPGPDARPVSVDDLTAELGTAMDRQREQDRFRQAAVTNRATAKDAADRVNQAQEKIAALHQQIAALEKEIERLKHVELQAATAAEQDEVRAAAVQVPDVAALRGRIQNAETSNARARAATLRAETSARVEKGRGYVAGLTKAIEEIDAAKVALLAGAKIPVPGLSVSDLGVMVDGVPFEQASASKRLRVSVAVAMALNPKLRVILVRDASLLDPEGLATLGEMAKTGDYQVWVEQVGSPTEGVGIVIEDGAVAAVDGQRAKGRQT